MPLINNVTKERYLMDTDGLQAIDKPALLLSEFKKLYLAKQQSWMTDPVGRFKSIKDVFDFYFKENKITVNKAFVVGIMKYVHGFETATEEHIKFLGGNLIGVYKFRYTKEDERDFIEEVIGFDDWDTLTEDFKDQRYVNPDWEVTSNPINSLYVYLAHRIMFSTTLSKREIEGGAVAVWRMMHYKFITSLLQRSYKYAAQESVAMALYESLSNKSLLKRYHTWYGLVTHRAETLAAKHCVHHEAIKAFAPDSLVLYTVADTQTRIRKLIVKLNQQYHAMLESDTRVLSEGAFITMDGEAKLKDTINDVHSMTVGMHQVVRNPVDFIKEELLEQVYKSVGSAQPKHVMILLNFIVDNANEEKRFNVDGMVEKLIIYISDYYRENGQDGDTLVRLAGNLINLFRTSQLAQPDIIKVREEMDRICDASPIGLKSKSITAPAKVATLTYLAIRVLTYSRYK